MEGALAYKNTDGVYLSFGTCQLIWCGIKKLTVYSQGFHNKIKRIRRYSKWHVNTGYRGRFPYPCQRNEPVRRDYHAAQAG